MNNKANVQPLTGSGLYEYAFVPVPQSQRKSGRSIFFVLGGYTSTLSCLVIGANIGASMPFWQAVGACILGDLLLVFIGTGMGMISAKTGWSTAFLVQRILGKSASVVFSILLLFCTVMWVGVNGNLFSSMVISVFPNWCLPVSVTSILIIALWAKTASGGWKSLDIVSRFAMPGSMVLLFYAMFQLLTHAERMGSFLVTGKPMTFALASTAIMGNFICGCISTPDTCRFADSAKTAAIVCPPAYAVGMFLFHFCGIIIARVGGYPDLYRSATVLGILMPIMLCTICCLTTTQNINIYISSLALQNIFQGTRLEGNVSHKTVVYLMAGVAVAFSVSGISDYLVPMVSYFSIIMVPFPGMLLGEAIFFRNKTTTEKSHYETTFIWLMGIGVGMFFLWFDFPVGPFWEMLFSGACYVGINKWSRAGRRKKI